MAEIAKRMDVKIEWQDMPFDSLIRRQEGKIDASISCFITPKRAQLVDFPILITPLRMPSCDEGFIKTLPKPKIQQITNSVSIWHDGDEWITEELNETGLMSEQPPATNGWTRLLLILEAGRIDILMADDVPAGVIASQDDDLEIIYKEMLYTGRLTSSFQKVLLTCRLKLTASLLN